MLVGKQVIFRLEAINQGTKCQTFGPQAQSEQDYCPRTKAPITKTKDTRKTQFSSLLPKPIPDLIPTHFPSSRPFFF